MRSKGFSPMWLVLIVAVVGFLVILAYGFANLVKIGGPQIPQEVPTVEDSQVTELETLSDSDEVNVIESELGSTNIEALDQGLNEELQSVGL